MKLRTVVLVFIVSAMLFAASSLALSVYRVLNTSPAIDTAPSIVNVEQPYSPVSYDAMAELINVKRSENGVKPALTNSKALNASAQLKANDMVKSNYWAHNDPEGNEPWRFFHAVGYKYKSAGENLAKCYYTPEAVVDAWFASPEHRANILGDYEDIGFGVGTLEGGCLLIVNHFGKLK